VTLVASVTRRFNQALPLAPFVGFASFAKTDVVELPAAFAFLSCFGFFFSLLLFI
tara:strand:+ start:13684 stop:13848 length:165 start_codon:yes stop_codon:yes gene_type:complete